MEAVECPREQNYDICCGRISAERENLEAFIELEFRL